MQRSRLAPIAFALLVACGGGSKPESIGNATNDNAARPQPTQMTNVVMQTQAGGIIELNPKVDPDKAMHRATDEMTAHCGRDNFTIIQEGEEAIGQDTTGTTTRTLTAWRVHYVCNDAISKP
jgi:hypothetical protein